MKILVTADPELPVPPQLYGGIERIIDLLVHGLVDRGHDVTLIAHPDSSVGCRLIPYKGETSKGLIDTIQNMSTVTNAVLVNDFDVVHSFGRLAYVLPILPLSIPKLMTYQREVTPRSVRYGHLLSRGTLHYCAISDWMMQETKHLANWHRVYNGVPIHVYDFQATVAEDAPLFFLGRIEYIKGTHLAIDIARKSGRRLVIAGNIPKGHEGYFETEIKPYLDDKTIRYVGPVDDSEKNILLGQAAAFLMPILWEEPFGIVMAEALACGTPVIGLRRGSVPEVVADGVTGYVCDSVDDMVKSVKAVDSIKRLDCRQRAERLFGDRVLVDSYLSIYENISRKIPSS